VLVSVVDNARREIYGQRYLDGEYAQLDGEVARVVSEALAALREAADRVAPGAGGAPGEAELAAALRAEASRVVGRLPGAAER
jgi:hypothetical protein